MSFCLVTDPAATCCASVCVFIVVPTVHLFGGKCLRSLKFPVVLVRRVSWACRRASPPPLVLSLHPWCVRLCGCGEFCYVKRSFDCNRTSPFPSSKQLCCTRSSESFEPWRRRDVPRAGRRPRRRAARGWPSARPSAARRGVGRSAVPAGASPRRAAMTLEASVRPQQRIMSDSAPFSFFLQNCMRFQGAEMSNSK